MTVSGFLSSSSDRYPDVQKSSRPPSVVLLEVIESHLQLTGFVYIVLILYRCTVQNSKSDMLLSPISGED
jgi:hypothetical protein